MRFLLAFVLSVCLSFNAAYAAGSDVCDTLEAGTSGRAVSLNSEHEEHFGHHLHDHQHTPDADAKAAPPRPIAGKASEAVAQRISFTSTAFSIGG